MLFHIDTPHKIFFIFEPFNQMAADETACAADERFFCTDMLFSLNFSKDYFTGYDFYPAIPGFYGFRPFGYTAN
jgi:hypothetical protein